MIVEKGSGEKGGRFVNSVRKLKRRRTGRRLYLMPSTPAVGSWPHNDGQLGGFTFEHFRRPTSGWAGSPCSRKRSPSQIIPRGHG